MSQNSTTFREIPYSPEYCDSLIEVAKSMDTWNPDNQTYHISEHRKFMDQAKVPHTKAQVDQCVKFWETVRSDELVDVRGLIEILKVQHDPKLFVKSLALGFDADKNGFISAKEYQVAIETLKTYDPKGFEKLGGINFEDFVREADTDGDLRVSVDEFALWLEKQK